jgi:hypothetical protein
MKPPETDISETGSAHGHSARAHVVRSR